MRPESDSLDRITTEASDWFVHIRTEELSPAERERFATWLEASPVHVREYLAMAEAWDVLKRTGAPNIATADELIRASKDTANIVMLPSASRASVQARGRHWLMTTAVVALLTAIVILVVTKQQTYSTDRGEQRTVVLEDQSVIQLNTLSKITVHFSNRHRRVEIDEGEAYFRVAHDPSRPFDVVTPAATVRAVGTQFNVYSRDHKLKVAVLDGRVNVSAVGPGAGQADGAPRPSAEPNPPISLAANDAVEIDGGTGLITQSVNAAPTAAIAWIQRRLSFDNARLDDVIAEFNRYTSQQMRVEDPGLASLRISGVFEADNPGTLVSYLEQIQDVQVSRQGTSIVLSFDVSEANL